MTIEEAIKHAEEVAERLRSDAHVYEDMAIFKRSIKHNTEAEICKQECERCEDCAEEHLQLAEWLKELKEVKTLVRVTEKLWHQNVRGGLVDIVDGHEILFSEHKQLREMFEEVNADADSNRHQG